MAATSPSDSRGSGGYRTPVSPFQQSLPDQVQKPSFLIGFKASKATKDGDAPKKRGPKPDSKPALTKRQEMNRLAQRTHRERKDQYAHELEARVMQARDTYFEMVREREQLKHENNEMAQLLRSHGIQYQSSYIRKPSTSQHSSFYSGSPGGSFSGPSLSRTHTIEGSPFQGSISVPSPNGPMRRSPHSPGRSMGFPTPSPVNTSSTGPGQSPTNFFEDTNQVPIGMAITTNHKAPPGSIPQVQGPGIFDPEVYLEFIWALEHTCIEHKRMMCERGTNANPTELSGHALMLTSPPEDHHYHHRQDANQLSNEYYHQIPDIPKADLLRMLQTSSRYLEFGPEMNPVQALSFIQAHERFSEITLKDFEQLKDRLNKFMNCYGFGAVMPEYALRNELEKLFIQKDNELGFGKFNFNTPPTPYYS